MVLPAISNCIAMLIYLSEVRGVLETHGVLWPCPMGTTPKMEGQASSKLRFDKALLRYSQFQFLEIFLVQTQCAWASHHPQPFWSPYVEEKAPILTKLSVCHLLEKGLIWSHWVLPYRVTRDFQVGSQKGTLKVLSTPLQPYFPYLVSLCLIWCFPFLVPFPSHFMLSPPYTRCSHC